VLLRGGIPAFRDLSVVTDPGADIRQLEQALVELGYGSGITVDTTFTRATARAVTAWEKALGRPGADGVVTRGDVVFAPTDLRLAAVVTDLGTQVEAGDDVVEVTATAKVVTLPLSEDQVATIEAGMPVTVTLPDDKEAPGKITGVASEPTTVEDDEGNPLEVFPVTVALDDLALASAFDSGAVEVRVAHGGVEAAIAVPVVALVALSEGGYGLQVADTREATGYRLVPVEVGTIADDWAEVSGEGIEAGVDVVVPE
jgi:peptidoglycan hydrolase-like protein with peptidoglycan-binding domain